LSKYDPERSRQDNKISTRTGKKRKCSKKNAARDDDLSGASAHLTRFEKRLTNKPHEVIENPGIEALLHDDNKYKYIVYTNKSHLNSVYDELLQRGIFAEGCIDNHRQSRTKWITGCGGGVKSCKKIGTSTQLSRCDPYYQLNLTMWQRYIPKQDFPLGRMSGV